MQQLDGCLCWLPFFLLPGRSFCCGSARDILNFCPLLRPGRCMFSAGAQMAWMLKSTCATRIKHRAFFVLCSGSCVAGRTISGLLCWWSVSWVPWSSPPLMQPETQSSREDYQAQLRKYARCATTVVHTVETDHKLLIANASFKLKANNRRHFERHPRLHQP